MSLKFDLFEAATILNNIFGENSRLIVEYNKNLGYINRISVFKNNKLFNHQFIISKYEVDYAYSYEYYSYMFDEAILKLKEAIIKDNN